MEKDQLISLASQLSHPSGEKGTEIAQMMHETNIGMTKNAILNLELQAGDSVLELGHGNAGHLSFLFSLCEEIRYTGLEISELMSREALALNQSLAGTQKAAFHLYDGNQIPFEDQSFSKAFTVNTVYFWSNPLATLTELSRVLKPGALFSLTFAHRSFMETLPFTAYGFTLYNPDEILEIIAHTPFKLKHHDEQDEVVLNKAGEAVERHFSTLALVNDK